MFNWPKYIDITKNKPPRKLLVRSLEYVTDNGAALDLGAGALNDSSYLLNFGFKKVIAVDSEENKDNISEVKSENFCFEKSTIENYKFPVDYFNLVNAQFVLPYIDEKNIQKTLNNIKISLKERGIFVGQFFGNNDGWNNRQNIFVYDCDYVKKLLSDFETVYFLEEEYDGNSAMNGEKHWHLINFIVKKI